MGYSMIAREQKVSNNKRLIISLPELDKPIRVIPRDKNGNEHIEVVCGKFMYQTKNLMFLKKDVSYEINYFVSYSKQDFRNGIYQYEYL